MRTTLNYIKSDCYRYNGKADAASILLQYLKDKTFRWQVTYRLYHSDRRMLSCFGNILWRFNHNNNIHISLYAKIGYGLYIGHGGPIFINAAAVIGNNCNLSQLTTIGSNDNNAAIIGDNVYIGPNVCIVEGVKIGNNATIGAGSVVTKDIPANATAAGNYAKVLNYDNPGRYIRNRWPI